MQSLVTIPAAIVGGLFILSAGPAWGAEPELPRVYVDTTPVRSTGRTIPVRAGGDLQAALDVAAPGDTIKLEAGARFTGNFILPNKVGEGWITVRTRIPDNWLPPPGTRVTPLHAPVLAKIVSPNTRPALAAPAGAHHYRFIGVEITFTDDVPINYNLILLGDRSASLADVPHHLIFDRVYIHGQPLVNGRRGIALNSAWTAVIDSYISEFHELFSDTQAIAGWEGPGPFKIVNNYLEAAGENLLFGGADPIIPDLVPSDIEIRHNHFFKPLTWRIEDPSYAGIPWAVKNLFELKNARRVLIDGNVFEQNWQHAQGGTAILFTVRNQSGTAPWSTVEDVTFTNNIVRHTGLGIGMHGSDDLRPSEPTKRILIRNNLFDDVSEARWGGLGRVFLVFRGVDELVIDHNTAFQDGSFVYAAGEPANMGFVFRNNVMPHNDFGIHGVGTAPGTHTLETYFPGYTFVKNVIVGNPFRWPYPPDNVFPPSLDDVGFVDADAGNYRLSRSSPYRNAATDGKDIGADFDALEAATAGVIPGVTNSSLVCQGAWASPPFLWPPNGQLVPVKIGLPVSHDSAFTVTITEIIQSSSALRRGSTKPDGVSAVQGDTAWLRAERSAGRNGPAYRARFVARHGRAAICTGSVWVGVP